MVGINLGLVPVFEMKNKINKYSRSSFRFWSGSGSKFLSRSKSGNGSWSKFGYWSSSGSTVRSGKTIYVNDTMYDKVCARR
jgi:hypothetical protein